MAGIKPEKLTVSKIKSNLLNVALSSLYRVTIPVPSAVRSTLNFSAADYENINLLCCEATLPGSSLTTHEVNNDYHGVTEKMAYRRLYDETIGLTFYVDRNYKIVELIEGWMDYISGMDNTRDFKSPYAGYRMAYPKTYKQDIFLTKFEKDQFVRDFSSTGSVGSTSLRSVLEYTFVGAFPITLTAIPVSYEEGSVLKCSASFNFIRYVQEKRADTVSVGEISDRLPPINRDPTLGMNDLIRTIGTRSATT